MNKFVEARKAFFKVLGYNITDSWLAKLEKSEEEWTKLVGQKRLEHLVAEGMLEEIPAAGMEEKKVG